MEEIKLDVQIRNDLGKQNVKKVRGEDSVPAIVYGGKNKPTPIKVDRRSYEKIMRQHQGQSVLFHRNVMENDKKLRDYSAIVKEEQHHPVTNKLVHIDFNRISLKDEIEVQVPIKVKGEAIGVKRDGGSLDHHLWEIDVVCLPTNIPERVEVDVSALEIGDSIHVNQLTLPANVKTKHDGEDIVVSVVPPMREEEAVETDEGVEPEVTKEKKSSEEKAEDEGEEKTEDKKE
ncbi:MAG: 50S ribosomal protein L25 [Candidatus Omnitrophica bacterium]|nr:50S ribosomal protein L25 [Candidatus Omnitrophota bacterium]